MKPFKSGVIIASWLLRIIWDFTFLQTGTTIEPVQRNWHLITKPKKEISYI